MAMQSKEANEWNKAIDDELRLLEKYNTLEIVETPKTKNVHVLHCMWLLKKKRTADGKLSRYKAHLVVCGNEDAVPSALTFAPVVVLSLIYRCALNAISGKTEWLVNSSS